MGTGKARGPIDRKGGDVVAVAQWKHQLKRGQTKRQPAVRAIEVPLSLLLARDLTPAAKLLWIRLRFDALHPRRRSCHPRQLAKRTCLSRSTVYEVLRRASAAGWLVPQRDRTTGKARWRAACPVRDVSAVVRIPVDLIRAAHALRPQEILCYGFLQATPGFSASTRTGTFKWAELHEMTGLHLRTVKRAVRALAEARWIAMAQENRRARIWFRLQFADEAYREEVKRTLEQAEYRGEALMRSFLSIITDTRECEDGARPEFLVNPASGERMELDRYYPVHKVAFEFNGRQHYAPTGRFSRRDVAAQRKRDRLKRRICEERGVKLIVVHAEDLSFSRMLELVGALLPRRALRGFRRTIKFLDQCGLRYRKAAAWG